MERTKKRNWLWAAVLLMGMVMAGLTACNSDNDEWNDTRDSLVGTWETEMTEGTLTSDIVQYRAVIERAADAHSGYPYGLEGIRKDGNRQTLQKGWVHVDNDAKNDGITFHDYLHSTEYCISVNWMNKERTAVSIGDMGVFYKK